MPTHVSQFVLFSRAIISKLILSTSSQENLFVFCQVTTSTAKQCETWSTGNLFREVMWKNMRNLYTHFVSHVFLGYKRVLWPSRKSSVAILKMVHIHDLISKFSEAANVRLRKIWLTLLSFSPTWNGIMPRKVWNPALIDCIRRRSFELAISRRILFSSTEAGVPTPEVTGGMWATATADESRDMFGVTGDSAVSLFKLSTKRNLHQ